MKFIIYTILTNITGWLDKQAARLMKDEFVLIAIYPDHYCDEPAAEPATEPAEAPDDFDEQALSAAIAELPGEDLAASLEDLLETLWP